MQISGEVNDIILKGYELAKGNKDEFVTAEHLLYGITFVERFINALSKLNGSAVNLRKKLDEYISEYIEEGDVEGPIESYSFQQAIIKASEHAVFSSQKSITMEHLISAIYDLENSYASYYLQEEGIEKRDLLYKLCHEENEDDEYMEEGLISEGDEEINMDEENTKNKGTLLKTLTINLNEIVKNDNSDPLIGRKDILERTIQILCRRNKNNPIHVGEPGVGKTAITLGLARLINKGEVPEKLKNAEIFSLDIGAALAGTKYRGDFEERIKKVLNEIQTHENPIVYIDEIHNIVGAGSIDGGSLDTSNLLKPYLVSGKVKFIGATTFDEYKKYFEKDEISSLKELEENLEKNIFGQDMAIHEIVRCIKTSRAGLNNENKPISSLLFVGPTGVGKTEVAKTLADSLVVKLIRFDMSEYAEKHAAAKLIGAPPGYVGYEEGGLLTDTIRKNPYCVLLLDEVEKAHPDILNVLLQVMDYATLSDNQGRKADFRNVLLIMTSNAGAKDIGKSVIGFGDRIIKGEAIKEEIKKFFTPEFRNRLDKIVVFNHLNEEMALNIAKRELDKFNEILSKKNVKVNFDDKCIDFVAKKGISQEYGAREILRVINQEIKPMFVDEILFGKLSDGGEVAVTVNNDKFIYS